MTRVTVPSFAQRGMKGLKDRCTIFCQYRNTGFRKWPLEYFQNLYITDRDFAFYTIAQEDWATPLNTYVNMYK